MKRGQVARSIAALAPLLLSLGAVPAARSASPPEKSTLGVFAAASLSGAFAEIGHVLEQQHAGLSVQLNFAGSQQLETQLEQGASAGVFASADERWMAQARDHGLLADSAAIFARNRLVVIVPKTNPARIRRLQDLARGGVKLVLGADAVPVGHYSRTVLANLARDPSFGGDFATRVLGNLASEEENVKSVVGKVQLGEADAGIAYRSDVTPAVARFVRVLEIPERANVTASYPIAVLKSTPKVEDARAFVELVLSPSGQRILERWGLIPASAPH
jgi:molybdate transport system substrate-binding protein